MNKERETTMNKYSAEDDFVELISYYDSLRYAINWIGMSGEGDICSLMTPAENISNKMAEYFDKHLDVIGVKS